MPQQQSDPFAAYAVGGGKPSKDDPFAAFVVKTPLPTRPVSAEDFTAPEPSGFDKAMSVAGGVGRGIAGMVTGAGKLAYDVQKAAMLGGNFGSGQALAQDVRGLVGAQGEQFRKAASDVGQGRYSEAAGHTAAGLLPLAGPAAAAVGEKAETDPYGAAGEALTMVGAPALARGVAPAARVAGRGASAAGRGAVELAANPNVGTSVGSAVGASMGGSFGAMAGTAVGRSLSELLGRVIENSKTRKAGPVVDVPPPRMKHGPVEPPLPPRMRHGPEQPPQAPPEPVTEVVPPRMKHGPEPPRAEKPPKPTPSPEMGPRNYFMRPNASTAAPAAEPTLSARGPVDVSDLPVAWRSRTMQNVGPASGAEAKQIAEGLRQVIDETGVSVSEAINAVAREKGLPPNVRLELMQALTTMRPRRR